MGPARRPGEGYRADIDGLRAVAVLAVVAFHAFPAWFPGGFVGVDVFFVISGYLITGILVEEHDADRFSFLAFYARRARRIFPALALVLIATIALGALLLPEHENTSLGRHVVGGALFSSNFVLWSEAGYFDAASTTKPLLHLWSLGIEEQFYLLWPAVMVVLARRRRHRATATAIILAASFTLGVLTLRYDPSAAFYSPAARAWELMVGALLAMTPRPAAGMATRPLREVLSVAGALGVAAALILFTPATSFPGWHALLPVIGTALLLAAGADTWLNQRLLSARVVVSVGLVSYPLYLWHWPLLVMARRALGFTGTSTQLPPAVAAAVVVASIAGAYLTFTLLERPLRRSPVMPVALRASLALAATAMLGVVVAISRTELDQGSLLATQARNDWGTPTNTDAIYFASAVRSGPTIVFLGDSHAEQYYPAVRAALARQSPGLGVAFSTHRGCPLLSGYTAVCDQAYARSIALARSPTVRRVVIASAWERYLTDDYPDVPRIPDARAPDLFAQLAADVARLRALGKDVVVIRMHPSADVADPELLAAHMRVGTLGARAPRFAPWFPLDDFRRRTAAVDALLSQLAVRTGATQVDPAVVLCPGGRCITMDDRGTPIRSDSYHLRTFAAVRYLTYVPALLAPPHSELRPRIASRPRPPSAARSTRSPGS